MTEAETLREILYNAYSNPAHYPDDGARKYVITICCSVAYVIATRLDDGSYDVHSVEVKRGE